VPEQNRKAKARRDKIAKRERAKLIPRARRNLVKQKVDRLRGIINPRKSSFIIFDFMLIDLDEEMFNVCN
jgi:hypothetical protein